MIIPQKKLLRSFQKQRQATPSGLLSRLKKRGLMPEISVLMTGKTVLIPVSR